MTPMVGFEKAPQPIPDRFIAGAEALFGVRFPAAYNRIAREYGGAYGDADFRVDRPSPGFETSSIGLVLSLDPCSPRSVYATMANWPEAGLDPRVIPFGEDGGGNYLCLDYRTSDAPLIVLYFHELHGDAGLFRVCDSFEEFLARLRLPENQA